MTIELNIYGKDVEISASRDSVNVTVRGVEEEHIIEQLSISDIIRYHGVFDLLNEIGEHDVKSWLEDEGYIVTEEE